MQSLHYQVLANKCGQCYHQKETESDAFDFLKVTLIFHGQYAIHFRCIIPFSHESSSHLTCKPLVFYAPTYVQTSNLSPPLSIPKPPPFPPQLLQM
jgi:hypothetical protein